MTEAYIQRIIAHHTTAREAGVVFARTCPKLAVYTHLVFLASKQVPSATVADLIAETRQTYSGPLEVGEDLMLCVPRTPSRMHAREPAALISRSGAKFLWQRPSLFVPPILLGKPLPTMRRYEPGAVRSSLASG
jgi:hypothetical protein